MLTCSLCTNNILQYAGSIKERKRTTPFILKNISFGPEKGRFKESKRTNLASETIQGTSLPLKGVNYVHGSYGFPLGVLCVGDSIANHVLEEDLQHTACLFVDETGDTFNSTTASQATNCGLGDTLDIVPEHLPVTLGASLPETFTTLSASCHSSLCSASLQTK